jgi:hypothetical protein
MKIETPSAQPTTELGTQQIVELPERNFYYFIDKFVEPLWLPASRKEIANIFSSERSIEDLFPVTALQKNFALPAMLALLFSEREWAAMCGSPGFTAALSSALSYQDGSQSPVEQELGSGGELLVSLLSRRDQIEPALSAAIRSVNKWVDDWNIIFLQDGEDCCYLKLKTEIDKLGVSINPAEVIQQYKDDIKNGTDLACPALKGKINVSDKDDAPAQAILLELDFLLELYSVGNHFRNRLGSSGNTPSYPNWHQLTSEQQAQYFMEADFYARYGFLAGVFFDDPKILAHAVMDHVDSKVLSGQFSLPGFEVDLEQSLSTLFDLDAGAAAMHFPETWQKILHLSHNVGAALQPLAFERLLSDPDTDAGQLLYQMVHCGRVEGNPATDELVLNPGQTEQFGRLRQILEIHSDRSDGQAAQVQIEEFVAADGHTSLRIFGLDADLTRHVFAALQAPKVPASPATPRSVRHSAPLLSADYR